MGKKSRAVVPVDPILVVRPPLWCDGQASPHPIDEPRARGTVDATEAHHRGASGSRERHSLALQVAQALQIIFRLLHAPDAQQPKRRREYAAG